MVSINFFTGKKVWIHDSSYYVLGTIQNDLHVFIHLVLTTILEVGIIIILPLQLRKLSHRELSDLPKVTQLVN